MPNRKIDRIHIPLVGQKQRPEPYRQQRILIPTLIHHLHLLNPHAELFHRNLGHPTFLIRVIELLLNKSNSVELVSPEELLYLLELIDQEEYFLAVEFEFEVGHAEIDCAAGPFHYAVVLDQRDALSIEPEEGFAPGEVAIEELEVLHADAQVETTCYFYLDTHIAYLACKNPLGYHYLRLVKFLLL